VSDDRFQYSTNKAHNGAYIVYINGIEVPVTNVSMRYGVWQIPECSISMVPDPVLLRFGAEDRVQVAVFFLDDFNPQPNQDPAVFRLLMEGEIVGWGYQSTPSGRAISFTVVNQIAIWTQLFVHFIQNIDDMASEATNPARGVVTSATVAPGMLFPQSIFSQGISPSPDAPKITRPFDFAYNLVRSMTSTAVPDTQRAVPSANFFSRWARLTNFINRFVATPVFDETALPGGENPSIFPALRALQSTSVIDLITHSLIAPVQNSGSFWDMLQLVLQTMFTELAMIPVAPLLNVNLKDSTIAETKANAHTVTKGRPTKDPTPTMPTRLANYFVKPQLIFGLPPSCNVFFPSQIKSYSYEENYATQPTRLYFNDEVLNRLIPNEGQLGQTVLDALAVAYPEEANAHSVARRYINGNANGKNFLLFPEEFFKGPVMDRRPMPNWLYFLKMQEMNAEKALQDLAKKNGVVLPRGMQVKALPNGEPEPSVESLYAEYEYYRERYSRRGGNVILSGFQPFAVPGFPCAIFDNKATRFDVVGYATTVQHSLSARGLSTQVAYTYGRTFQEVLDKLQTMYMTDKNVYAMAPREPISDVRLTIQEFDNAETFYNALFYGRTTYTGKKASFCWTDVIGYAPDATHKNPEPIFMQGGTESQYSASANAKVILAQATTDLEDVKLQITSQQNTLQQATATVANESNSTSTVDQTVSEDAAAAAEKAQAALKTLSAQVTALETSIAAQQAIIAAASQATSSAKVVSNVTGDRPLQPLPAFAEAFQNYDAAMKYNWRPVCSLDEYIVFYNSVGENEIPASKHPRSLGARYYERIRRLTGYDPDTTPLPPNSDGVSPADSEQDPGTDTQAHPTVNGLNSKNFKAQTRTDWNEVLQAYRNNVYNVKAPRG
jgi:hypothetical protein